MNKSVTEAVGQAAQIEDVLFENVWSSVEVLDAQTSATAPVESADTAPGDFATAPCGRSPAPYRRSPTPLRRSPTPSRTESPGLRTRPTPARLRAITETDASDNTGAGLLDPVDSGVLKALDQNLDQAAWGTSKTGAAKAPSPQDLALL